MSSRVTACTSCRQVKLKCDVKETLPNACTRCRTRKLSCKMDPNFKRIPTRGRLAEVTKKLNNLQEVLAKDERTRLLVPEAPIAGSSSQPVYSNHSPSSMASSSEPLQGFVRNERPSGTSTQPGTTVSSSRSNTDTRQRGSCFFLDRMTHDAFIMGSKQLGEVTVNSETIEKLFMHYYRYRHTHLPIINTDITISKLYDSSHFLFWTIIHVSCRHNPEFADLEHKLTAPYNELLATTLITAVTSIQTVQALLLLCLYPFNVRRQHHEPSLNLCGFALSACLQMGLHHPDRLEDYGVLNISGSSIETRMTWMALFQISTFTSFTLGTPPLIQSPSHLESIRLMCCHPSIPRDFIAEVEIQRHVARYISSLENQTDLQARFSLTQVFDRELESIRAEFQDAWSPKAEFNLLTAKLYLCAMFISPKFDQGKDGNVLGGVGATGSQNSTNMTDTNRRMILNLGLAAVVRLVHVFRTQCGYGSNTQPSTPSNIFDASSSSPTATPSSNGNLTNIEFFPKFYFRSLVFSACYLLYYLLSTSPSTPSDLSSEHTTARTHIDIIHSIFKAFDIKYAYSHGRESRTYDVYRHAAETIDTLRDAMSDENFGTGPNKESALERWRVESRMGAGIFFGAVRMGWDKRRSLLRKEWEMMSGSGKNVDRGEMQRELQGTPNTTVNQSMGEEGLQDMQMSDLGNGDVGDAQFDWDQQGSADQWNFQGSFQWGIWGLPLMTNEQEMAVEAFGDASMGGFSQS